MCRSCPTVKEDEWDIPRTTMRTDALSAVRSMPEPTPYIVWFDEFTEDDRCRVGGKNASLATMLAAGLPVPPGFAVTTEAYETLRELPDLVSMVRGSLDALDVEDSRRLQKVAAEIREAIISHAVPAAVEHAIRGAYAQLCEHSRCADVGVAVRSSATAEDLPDASFAGQQDTYLWITGADAVVDHVRQCWASIFTDRAIAYRENKGYDFRQISMSVGVQKMVDPKAAGVAFTLNPLTGDRSQIAIDASWGLGEAVVSGEVTPDHFVVDKVLRSVIDRKISDKGTEYRRVDGVVQPCDIDAERRSVPCLSDDEICLVATMARRAEKHYGRPQDVEWALDRHLPDGENVILLQARPETVWSNKPRASVSGAGGYDPMRSIVSTLMSPMHNTK